MRCNFEPLAIATVNQVHRRRGEPDRCMPRLETKVTFFYKILTWLVFSLISMEACASRDTLSPPRRVPQPIVQQMVSVVEAYLVAAQTDSIGLAGLLTSDATLPRRFAASHRESKDGILKTLENSIRAEEVVYYLSPSAARQVVGRDVAKAATIDFQTAVQECGPGWYDDAKGDTWIVLLVYERSSWRIHNVGFDPC